MMMVIGGGGAQLELFDKQCRVRISPVLCCFQALPAK